MDAKVIIPLAALGIGGLYIYMKYKTEQEAQKAIIAGLQAGTIRKEDIVSVTDTETTFRIGGKNYTLSNKVLGRAASSAGQAVVNLLTSWFGKDTGPTKYTVELEEFEPLEGTQLGDATRAARNYALGRGFFRTPAFKPTPWGGAPTTLCIVDQG